MKFGVTLFVTDESISVVDLAREAEQRGFDSLWLPEHTHVPIGRDTPYPGGGDLPREYHRTVDPLVALGAAAAVTSTIRLGTGILLAAQHDPIIAAKAVATVDQISGGRMTLGIGYGWSRDEMRDHGVDPQRRRGQTREHLLAMQALWADEVASYDGSFVQLQPSWSWPKPVQTVTGGRTGVPVLIGGAAGPKLFSHVVEYADGWMPIGASNMTENVRRLRELMQDAGRDPDSLEIVPFGSRPDHGKFDFFDSVGITEVIFTLPPATRDVVLPQLDELAAFAVERRSRADADQTGADPR